MHITPSCSLFAAITFAERAHNGHTRISGEASVNHPIAVLEILFRLTIDLPLEAYIAAVLHDVLEQPPVTVWDIDMLAGPRVGRMVQLLTPGSDTHIARLEQACTVYPCLSLIALADRLHELLTMASLSSLQRDRLLDAIRSGWLPFFRRTIALPELRGFLEDLESALREDIPIGSKI